MVEKFHQCLKILKNNQTGQKMTILAQEVGVFRSFMGKMAGHGLENP